MITVKRSVETVFFITLITAVTLFVMVQTKSTARLPVFSAPIPETVSPFPTDVPPGEIKRSFMESPQGGTHLTLESQRVNDGILYSVYVSSRSGELGNKIYQGKETKANTLTIPFNAWSTDMDYVFLESRFSSITDYLIFQASGAIFSDGSPYLSVQQLFKAKVPNYSIEDVTGWAGSTSLIVNTKAVEGEQRVSFWFEVPSQSFIQLGTYFK